MKNEKSQKKMENIFSQKDIDRCNKLLEDRVRNSTKHYLFAEDYSDEAIRAYGWEQVDNINLHTEDLLGNNYKPCVELSNAVNAVAHAIVETFIIEVSGKSTMDFTLSASLFFDTLNTEISKIMEDQIMTLMGEAA